MAIYGRPLVQLQLRLDQIATELLQMADWAGQEGSWRTAAQLDQAVTLLDSAARSALRELEAADQRETAQLDGQQRAG